MKIKPAGIDHQKQINRIIHRTVFVIQHQNNRLTETICLSSRVKCWAYLAAFGKMYHCLYQADGRTVHKGQRIKSYWSFTRAIIEGNHYQFLFEGENGNMLVTLNKYPLL
jgi:hypothetical protein